MMLSLVLVFALAARDFYSPGIPFALEQIPVMDAASPATPPQYDAPHLDPLAQRAADLCYRVLCGEIKMRVPDYAAKTLLDMGPGALPLLFSALRSDIAQTRASVARVMLHMGPEDKAQGPLLAAAAAQDVHIVRLFAVNALGLIGDAYEQSAAVLTKALDDPSESVRLCAIARFSDVGYKPEDSVLKRLAQSDPNQQIRNLATGLLALPRSNGLLVRHQLRDMGHDVICPVPPPGPFYKDPNPAIIKENMKLLRKSNSDAKISAAKKLAEYGPGARCAVTRLVRLLRDRYPSVRASAAMALRDVGPRDPKVIKALTRLLREENPKVITGHLAWLDPVTRARDAAAWALGNMMPEAAETMPDMIAGLAWPPIEKIRDRRLFGDQTVSVINGLICAGPTALPAIQEALGSPDVNTRDAAIRIALMIEDGEERLAEADLFRALRDSEVTGRATNELVRRGALVRALPHLEPLVSSPNSEVQRYALMALQRLGADAQSAVPWVVAAFKHTNSGKRYNALASSTMLRTLGYIGRGSNEAAEAVLTAAETQGISHPSVILSLDMLFADPPELWKIQR